MSKEEQKICPETNSTCQYSYCRGACSIREVNKHLTGDAIYSDIKGTPISELQQQYLTLEAQLNDEHNKRQQLEMALYETQIVLNRMIGMVDYIEHAQKWMERAEEDAAYILRKYSKITDCLRSEKNKGNDI